MEKLTAVFPHRPQPPAFPRLCRGGDPLPDGGCNNRHDVTKGMAPEPRSGAFPPGDHGCAGYQPDPQPGHHRHLQRPVTVETAPRLQPAAQRGVRLQRALKEDSPPTAIQWLIPFPKERSGLFVSAVSVSFLFNTSTFIVQM